MQQFTLSGNAMISTPNEYLYWSKDVGESDSQFRDKG